MEAGTVIGGRFAVERLLGGGAIADVYLAHDRILDSMVALKVLHAHLLESDAVCEAFRREVAVSRLLEHPNVARTHEIGIDSATGAVFLSMECYPGGDLKRRLPLSGRLQADELARLGSEVLGALAAARSYVRGVDRGAPYAEVARAVMERAGDATGDGEREDRGKAALEALARHGAAELGQSRLVARMLGLAGTVEGLARRLEAPRERLGREELRQALAELDAE